MEIKPGDVIILTGKVTTFDDKISGVYLNESDRYHWFAVVPKNKNLKGLEKALKHNLIRIIDDE